MSQLSTSKMKSFVALALLAVASVVSAHPVERDAGANLLVNDLLVLDNAIKNITIAANGYAGGVEAYQPIRESLLQVNYTNRIAYFEGMKIKPQSTDDSNKIIAVVADPIQPDITAAIDALIAKKDLIDAAGLAAETAAGLNLISSDHDTLSLFSVAPKLELLTIPSAVVPVLHIDLDWRRGVLAFGGLPLAPLTGSQFAGNPVEN